MRKLGARTLMDAVPACVPSALFVLSVLSVLSLAGEATQPPADPAKAKQDEEQKLISVLKDGQPFDKDKACRRLAVIGSKEAVLPLAALLLDEKLCDVARNALEAIPDPAAEEALRAALGKVKGRQLVGVVNSIGARRDARAVDDLAKLVGDADADVAGAAARSLARIGGPEAAKVLKQALSGASTAARPAIGDACIALADGLLVAGKGSEAAPIYDALRKEVYRQRPAGSRQDGGGTAEMPKQVVAAALRGAVLARQAEGLPLLVENLTSTDKEMARIAFRLARELPGAEVTKALAAELAKLPTDRQVLLILALGDRHDPAAAPAILGAAKGGDPAVSITALRVLAQVGDASVVPLLLEAATGQGEVAKAAQATLAGFPATKEVDAAIVAMMDQGDVGARHASPLRRAAIELAGQRRIAAAAPSLLKAADDVEAAIRTAAIKALGETVAVADLPTLTSRLVKAKTPQDIAAAESALSAACNRLPDKAACGEKILAALNGGESEGAPKAALLRLLRLTGGNDALQAVRAGAKDARAEVQDAAIRSLAEWPTTDAAADLADLAKSAANPTHKVLALRGYVRLIGIGDLPADRRLALCKEAMGMAQRDDEKKLVLAGLGEIPHADALKMAESCLENKAVRAEAELAVLKIARGMAGASRDEAKAALEKLIASSALFVNSGLKKQAQDVLAQIDRFGDFLTAWQVAGPYEGENKSPAEVVEFAFPPEKPDAKGVAWRVLPAGTQPAKPMMLDLANACGGGDQMAAYARTWVYSAQEQPVRLEFGSDDGNKVWLNGKLVATHPEGGAATPGKFKVDVTLKQGWNALVVKIAQQTGPWEFCFRICRPDGSRLSGLRVQALPPAD